MNCIKLFCRLTPEVGVQSYWEINWAFSISLSFKFEEPQTSNYTLLKIALKSFVGLSPAQEKLQTHVSD